MRMPVLESVIDGRKYVTIHFPWGEESFTFDEYLDRINSCYFDSTNPFGFNSLDFLCNFHIRETADVYEKRIDMKGYKVRRSEAQKEYLIRELELLCDQLYFFENDYDEYELLEKFVVDTFESLLVYLNKCSVYRDVEIFLGMFIVDFYTAYRKELNEWGNRNNQNKRLLKNLLDEHALPWEYADLSEDLKNRKNLTAEIGDVEEVNIDDKIAEARRRLEFLNCEYKGKRFMSEGDYRRMLSWVEVLIREGKCPEQTGALTLGHSKDWVKYTLYLIQKEVMNFKKDDEWVRLAWIIGGSEGEFSTIKTKFSTAPKVVKNRVVYDEVVSKLVEGVR